VEPVPGVRLVNFFEAFSFGSTSYVDLEVRKPLCVSPVCDTLNPNA
jgi:hypothetical protein